MHAYQSALIRLALEVEALRFGQFTLKSGRISPYFFNMGHFNTGSALAQLGECYALAILEAVRQKGLQFDMLFGPAYKGIPLVSTVAIALANHQKDCPYSFNRKEIKAHGEGGMIVGAGLKGRVLIIDDVITAGTAARESIDLIHAQGAIVAGLMVALDRQEKGNGGDKFSAIQRLASENNISVFNIINLNDITRFVEDTSVYHAWVSPISAYQREYGVI